MLALARRAGDAHRVGMAKKSDMSLGGKVAVAAGAAIGSAAVAAALLYARKTVRKELPKVEDVYPIVTHPPETD